MKIVVIGGTGLVGAKLVTRLAERHDVAELVSGDGLAEAVEGAAAVVDVSNAPVSKTRDLLAVEATLGVVHHVALCADAEQEALIEGAGIPFSIVRAKLFFESPPATAAAAADEVAAVLRRVAIGPPLGRAYDVWAA
jgi:uncharacterized protein YbjT (DUF2867 family)